jgi:carboxyl-terminal processing protease
MQHPTKHIATIAASALIALSLTSCGGGGGAGGTSLVPTSTAAGQCGASLTTQKDWIRSYMDQAYLWYNEIPPVDANGANFVLPLTQVNGLGVPASLDNYFNALRTPNTTASGARRDQFSFTYSTTEWNKLSQSGVEFGYGIQWAAIASTPPRKYIVAFTEPNSPAGNNNVLRGAEIVSVDGEDFVNGSNVDVLNAGLFPSSAGKQTAFVLRDVGAATTRTVTLTSGDITKTPVQNVKTVDTATGKVGYLTFNDHIATSEQQLIDAINTLKAANITDLVLDLRYNGGGYLYIAAELAYMIAGASRTNGKNFESTRYNNKRSNENGNTPFYNASCILVQSGNNFQCTNEQPLPTLNLSRVYVIATADTCSASEAIINGLRGIDVDVRLLGSTTCGKPYGFTAKDNCGVSYFPIEFQGVNHKGFGDYSDGFIPGAGNLPTNVQGCAVADDYTKQLGDPAEGMFAAALNYRSSGACPATSVAKGKTGYTIGAEPAVLLRPPVRENRIYQPRS